MPWALWCVVTVGLDLLVLKKYENWIFKIFSNLMAIVNAKVIHNVVAVRSKLASRAMGSQVYHCGDYETKMRPKVSAIKIVRSVPDWVNIPVG